MEFDEKQCDSDPLCAHQCVDMNVRLLLVVVSAVLLSSCSVAARERVVERETGKPMEGVYVINKWQMNGGLVVPKSSCVHVEIAVTDKDGYFRIRGWHPQQLLPDVDSPSTGIYKPGYRGYKEDDNSHVYVMIKDTRSLAEQIRRLHGAGGAATACGYNHMKNNPLLAPLLKAVYEEGKALLSAAKPEEVTSKLRGTVAIAGERYQDAISETKPY